MEINPFLAVIKDNVKYIYISKELRKRPSDLDIIRCIPNIKECFKTEKTDHKILRNQPSDEVISEIENILTKHTVLCSEVLYELYRALRNSTTCESVQNFIIDKTKIVEITAEIIHKPELCPLKIILQFIANLVTSNFHARQRVSNELQEAIVSFIKKELCIYECSAILYNISLAVPYNYNIFEILCHLWNTPDHNEFIEFYKDNAINEPDFWLSFTKQCKTCKELVLDTILTNLTDGVVCQLPNRAINVLVTLFLKGPNIFYNINDRDEVKELYTVLKIIASLSSRENYLELLQMNRDIMVTASALLINFQKLGREGNNVFTPHNRLSEISNADLEHPLFGLKAELIRLIGNLCWKDQDMRDLARETEVIPVILDNCSIDSKNPFILQWCIFAIKNLCDNNIENQNIIHGLHKLGKVNSEILSESGVGLQEAN